MVELHSKHPIRHGKWKNFINPQGDRNDVTNYRPISCTNVIMKVFTSILKEKIHRRLNMNNESFKISSNQLGCKLQSLAAKE